MTKGIHKIRWCPAIRDQSIDLYRADARDTLASQLARIGYNYDLFGNTSHGTVQLRFENVGCGWARFEIQAIDRQKIAIGMQAAEHCLGLRAYQRTRDRPE